MLMNMIHDKSGSKMCGRLIRNTLLILFKVLHHLILNFVEDFLMVGERYQKFV
jgi:hypothetical protein